MGNRVVSLSGATVHTACGCVAAVDSLYATGHDCGYVFTAKKARAWCALTLATSWVSSNRYGKG